MQLARLRGRLDPYHQKRADKHGYIYWVLPEHIYKGLVEARSLATGVICTLEEACLEFVDDPQL